MYNGIGSKMRQFGQPSFGGHNALTMGFEQGPEVGFTGGAPGGDSGGFGGFLGDQWGNMKGIGSRLGEWATENPELASGVVGGLVSAYGQHQEGRAQDREANRRQEDIEYRRRVEEEERQRKAAAYQRILAGRGAG